MSEHTRIALSVPSTSGAAPTTALGTVLYRGPVPPTAGEWLGVEWDDASRGKHDGVYEKTGVRYFTCRQKEAGSFLRPTAPGLSYGVSLRSALHAKYLDDGSEQLRDEGSTFYATSSNFEVEVVPLSKVRDRFKQLSKLREVGLEWEGVNGAGTTDERAEVAKELAALEVLNLSYSLLSSLQAVDEVIADLTMLRTLSLNSNRFLPLALPTELQGFKRLTTLNLNRTLVDWNEILLLSSSLSEMRELQLGDNGLTSLSAITEGSGPLLPKLRTLNLDSNKLSDWEGIVTALQRLPSLDRLILSSNTIASLTIPSTASLQIRHLSLTSNRLSAWSSLDALSSQSPLLETLWVGDNPLLADINEGNARLEIIARVQGLTELEGSRVSPIEREDAEIWYVGKINKLSLSEEEKEKEHPRWKALVEKYSLSTAPVEKKATAMKSRLIHLTITPDESIAPLTPPPHTLAVLPTLRTLLLRTQISRLLGRPLPKTQWQLIAVLKSDEKGEEGLKVEIPAGEEGRDLSWWGLGDGDEVRVERRS